MCRQSEVSRKLPNAILHRPLHGRHATAQEVSAICVTGGGGSPPRRLLPSFTHCTGRPGLHPISARALPFLSLRIIFVLFGGKKKPNTHPGHFPSPTPSMSPRGIFNKTHLLSHPNQPAPGAHVFESSFIVNAHTPGFPVCLSNFRLSPMSATSFQARAFSLSPT